MHLFSLLLLLSALESVLGAVTGEFTTANWLPGIAVLSIGLIYGCGQRQPMREPERVVALLTAWDATLLARRPAQVRC